MADEHGQPPISASAIFSLPPPSVTTHAYQLAARYVALTRDYDIFDFRAFGFAIFPYFR